MYIAEVSDGVLISATCSKQCCSQQSDHISTLDVCHVLWPAAVEVLHTDCHVTGSTDSTFDTVYIEKMVALYPVNRICDTNTNESSTYRK